MGEEDDGGRGGGDEGEGADNEAERVEMGGGRNGIFLGEAGWP